MREGVIPFFCCGGLMGGWVSLVVVVVGKKMGWRREETVVRGAIEGK